MMEYNECDNDPYSGNGTGIVVRDGNTGSQLVTRGNDDTSSPPSGKEVARKVASGVARFVVDHGSEIVGIVDKAMDIKNTELNLIIANEVARTKCTVSNNDTKVRLDAQDKRHEEVAKVQDSVDKIIDSTLENKNYDVALAALDKMIIAMNTPSMNIKEISNDDDDVF